MRYAIVKNNEVAKAGRLQELFPGTSFPIAGPDEDFLEQNNLVEVKFAADYDPLTQKIVSVSPYFKNGEVYATEIKQLTKKELSSIKKANEAFDALRSTQ